MTEVRVFKPEEKLRIPVEGLSGIIQISRLCEKYGMDTRQFYLWKKLLSSTEIFSEKGRKSTAHEREIRERYP